MVNNINLKLSPGTKILVFSDVHLMLPISKELKIIEDSLVYRLNEFSKNEKAILLLNGDILELWAQKEHTAEQIIRGFKKLKVAIDDFVKSKNHEVFYVVGNHDEWVGLSSKNARVIENLWKAKVCKSMLISLGGRVFAVEHGHEFDIYNDSKSGNFAGGKNVVENVLPILDKYTPSVFGGISDIVERSLLPTYVLSNLLHRLIVPWSLILAILVSSFLTVYNSDLRYIAALVLSLLILWAMIIIFSFLSRYATDVFFGTGKSFYKKIDKFSSRNKFDVLVLGHTHQGGVKNREGYIYANSGCNDLVSFPQFSWLGLPKFTKSIQLSSLIISDSKNNYIKYNEDFVSLIK